jgi:hypothetical protein
MQHDDCRPLAAYPDMNRGPVALDLFGPETWRKRLKSTCGWHASDNPRKRRPSQRTPPASSAFDTVSNVNHTVVKATLIDEFEVNADLI